ncbi:MAG: dTDP-4-dehydrorhamnose reductase [Thermoanaerobaculia bacterium]
MVETAVAPTETLPEVLAAPHPMAQLRSRVLITGAGGMLGSDLVPVLAGAGCDVFARPRSDLDITREEDVAAAFRDVRPDVVVNCAAYTRVDAAEEDPRAFEVNVAGVRRLAQFCLRHSARFVQISTDFVFDGEKGAPYAEADPTNPLSAYGRSKSQGEEIALQVPAGLVVRTSWLFGFGGWNFIEAILKQVEDGKTSLRVVEDQRGKPTATPDLAQAILALLLTGAVGIYHFANRGEVSWHDFAREILRLWGREDVAVDPIASDSLSRRARRPAYSVLDTAKYENLTGQPIRHFRDPLAEYLHKRAYPA